jgi:hypothetical protein
MLYNVFLYNFLCSKKNLKCQKKGRPASGEPYTILIMCQGCDFESIVKNYDFYLAFENEITRDYFTEKLCRSLNNLPIPIVFGGANYTKIAPPNSIINYNEFMAETNSVENLAEYLNFLVNNPKEYEKYQWWKKHFKIVAGPPIGCSICDLLNNYPAKKSIKSLKFWWNSEKNEI